jgi:hypothetical protein
MISRRKLLLAAAPAALTLAGCSAQQESNFRNGLTNFAAQAYQDINVVAAFLESLIRQVAAGAITAAKAAASFAAKGAPYIVPGIQIFVSVVRLAGQVAAADPAIGQSKQFTAIYGQANVLAANPVIQAAAANGKLPSDPVTVLTGIIDLSAQILALTNGKASPTAAASAAA